jgi:glycosyl transferase family 87
MMYRAPQTPCPRAISLLRVVALVFGGQIVIFFVLRALFLPGASVFAWFNDGWDYRYFYWGAQAWLAGHDPYRFVPGFVTPPFSLVIPSLFSHLSLDRSYFAFFCCNLVLVAVSLWRYASALRLQRQERVLLLLVATLFVSAHECMRGGNMDGVMFALLVAAFSVRSRLMGALCLGASFVTKVYSVVFLPVALRKGQWRFAASSTAAGFALLLPFFRRWPSALHALAGRGARFDPGSIAPAALVYALRGEITRSGSILCMAFWLVTLSVALYRDHRGELSPGTLARYVPWMLGYPLLVFSYVGVLALAVLASLVATARKRPLRAAEHCIFIGFLLLGIHIEHATNVLPLNYETYHFFRMHTAVVQSLGTVLMMIGTCLSPCEEASKGEEQHEAGEETAVAGHSLPGRSRQAVPTAGF